MSSRTTRASPKRRNVWLAEVTAVTVTPTFRRLDLRCENARRYGWPGKLAVRGLA